MTAPQTVADVLDAAATRLEQPGAWTQDAYAKRSDGSTTTTTAEDAVCWCAVGAIGCVAGGLGEPIAERAADLLCETVETSVADFNDAPGRTQPEVVAALRAAATSARQGETK